MGNKNDRIENEQCAGCDCFDAPDCCMNENGCFLGSMMSPNFLTGCTNSWPAVQVGAYRIVPNAKIPQYQTRGSACADVSACLTTEYENMRVLKAYDEKNQEFAVYVKRANDGMNFVSVPPKCRVLIPTGLVLDIPKGFSVRVHPRSSLSFKKGLTIANGEGVIDSDYTDQLFVIIYNFSEAASIVNDGERVAQIELVDDTNANFVEIGTPPSHKTDRNGGIGSTGTH